MSETKWTPGPHYVGAMNDALFLLTQPPSPAGTDLPPDTPHPGQKVLAAVGSEDVSFEESMANAILWAAASDLYEALAALDENWMIGWFSGPEDPPATARFTDRTIKIWRQIRAAMAKARGEV